MAAGKAMLDALTPAVYVKLEKSAAELERGMRRVADELGLSEKVTINRIGSILTPFFAAGPIESFDDAKRSDIPAFKRWFHAMRKNGVFVAPAQFEAMFVSTAHGEKEIATTLRAHRAALSEAFGPAA
jgi:glutamate-1-semialdehyde 2,1-aminomutase